MRTTQRNCLSHTIKSVESLSNRCAFRWEQRCSNAWRMETYLLKYSLFFFMLHFSLIYIQVTHFNFFFIFDSTSLQYVNLIYPWHVPLQQFIMEHKLRNPPPPKPIDPKAKKKRFGAASRSKKAAFVPKAVPKDNDSKLISLDPLLQAIRSNRYTSIKFLYVWGVRVAPPTLTSLADLLRKGCYPLKLLDLSDCLLQPDPSLGLFAAYDSSHSLSKCYLLHSSGFWNLLPIL